MNKIQQARNRFNLLKRKFRKWDFKSFRPWFKPNEWNDIEPCGKIHLFYEPEEFEFDKKKEAKTTLCGRSLNKMSKKYSGEWGNYRFFTEAKRGHKCKVCNLKHRRALAQIEKESGKE